MLGGIGQLVGSKLKCARAAEAEAAVIEAASRVWGVRLAPEEPTPEEMEAARRLVSERYACDRWTRRR